MSNKAKGLVIVVCCVLSQINGCDMQSPNARIIDGFSLAILQRNGYPQGRFVAWDINPDGSEIYGAAFGYVVQATQVDDSSEPIEGIKFICEVNDHRGCCTEDQWLALASNGKPYGCITPLPTKNAKWNYASQIASLRSDSRGRGCFLIDFGNPQTGIGNSDPTYMWQPDTISQLVHLKFILPKKSNSVTQWGTAWFVKSAGYNFWTNPGGAFYSSNCCIGQTGYGIYATDNIKFTIQPCSFDDFLTEPCIPPRDSPPATYPLLGEPNLSQWAMWAKIKYDDVNDWHWQQASAITTLWSDPNEPNDLNELLESCNPYAFWARITEVNNVRAKQYNAILVARDSNNVILSRQRIVLYNMLSDSNGTVLVSDYIVPLQDRNHQGLYQVGVLTYRCLYLPNGGYMEVTKDEWYGDFNGDGIEDEKDLAILCDNWYSGIWDANYLPNTDADNSGTTDIFDFGAFAVNWLADREYVEGDYNFDGQINFQDFPLLEDRYENGKANLIEFFSNWLKGTL